MYNYAFILGREYKLSLAELGHIFGFENMISYNPKIAIFNLDKKLNSSDILTIGGTTRIIEIISEINPAEFPVKIIENIEKNFAENSKFSFAMASFGVNFPFVENGMRIKKTLSKNFSVRLLNSKNENIHSAVFKKEKLSKSGTEFCLVKMEENWEKNFSKNEEIWNFSQKSEKFYFGKTIACQDIDAYSRRDTAKNRDMITGMMPPKLVQMMINFLSKNWQKNGIYDPFCGLGTTLIEALNMGILKIAGSDINAEMVNNSLDSVENFIHEEIAWQTKILMAWGTPNKDFSEVETDFFVLDATKISEAFGENEIPKNINIISEGYLGKIIKKDEINQDMVFAERRNIVRLYEKFFEELKKSDYKGQIVMSLPFWKVRDVYIYIENIVEILDKNGFKIENLLPRELNLNTKNGSLLYRRESQNVGREIIKIVKK